MAHNPRVPLDVPYLTSRLIDRSMIELFCRDCTPHRYVIVDPNTLLHRWGDAFRSEDLQRIVCKACGKRMRAGSLRVAAMQHLGKLPKLTTADGSDWWWPSFRSRPTPRHLPIWESRR